MPYSQLASPPESAFTARGLRDACFLKDSASPWVTGWANPQPVEAYPLKADLNRVRFYFCWADDTWAVAQLRRHGQLIALEGGKPSSYVGVVEICAWWEDDLGLWLVTSEQRTEGQTLSSWAEKNPSLVDYCTVLRNVVERLKILNKHHFAAMTCCARHFRVLDSLEIVPTAFPDAMVLNGSEPSAFPWTSDLDDEFMRKHLRWLAPETVIARRPSATNDIYAFGVLAHELISDHEPVSTTPETLDILADVQQHLMGNITPLPTATPLSEIVTRCLAKDPQDRYASLDALVYDLTALGTLLRDNGDLSKLAVGEVDRLSRFKLPSQPIQRDQNLEVLHNAMRAVRKGSCRAISAWGLSGAGKTRIVQHFTQQALRENFLVAHSKLDEFVHRPLSSFAQLFAALLDWVLTDPQEDMAEWRRAIFTAVGNQMPFFISLLPKDARRLVAEDYQVHANAVDWSTITIAFKTWSKRLIQLFASAERPLILVVEDIQWMQQEESDLWKHMLDPPLKHVMVISTYRIETEEARASTLCAGSTSIEVGRLDERGVLAYLDECFSHRLSANRPLADLLRAETEGSPLFLGTLLVALVKQGAIYFDYDRLSWKYEMTALQSHLSDHGIDAYLGRLTTALPPHVRKLLAVLACLPSGGLSMRFLAQMMEEPLQKVEEMVHVAGDVGLLVMDDDKHVRFAHDRHRLAAYRAIPRELHLNVSMFLRRCSQASDFVFVAAEHALLAREVQNPSEPPDGLVTLLLEASGKAAMSASFRIAEKFLLAADDVIEESGGSTFWLQTHRAIYFRYLQRYAESCIALSTYERGHTKLESMAPLCETAEERVHLASLRVRLYIAQSLFGDALTLTWSTLSANGFDPEAPVATKICVPDSVQDVEAIASASQDVVDVEDVYSRTMTLIAFAGPLVYVADPMRRPALYSLGITLVRSLGRLHEASPYLLTVYALDLADGAIREALCLLGRRLAALRPGSAWTASTLINVAAQAHIWTSLSGALPLIAEAFDTAYSLGNYEFAAYAALMELGVRGFDGLPLTRPERVERYEALRRILSSPQRLMIDAPLQYAELLLNPQATAPWTMVGCFVSRSDMIAMTSVPLYAALLNLLALRLAILFDAPLEEQTRLATLGEDASSAFKGLSHHLEWSFLSTIIDIRNGTIGSSTIAQHELGKYPKNIDFGARLSFLRALCQVMEDPLVHLSAIEGTMRELKNEKQDTLSGLLSYYLAKALVATTGSPFIGTGFVRAACDSFLASGMYAVVQSLRDRYPTSCPPQTLRPIMPSQVYALSSSPPASLAATISDAATTTTTQETARTLLSHDDRSNIPPRKSDDILDAMTLMRSALALASEQDPSALLCTLLRLLCEFTRTDFAAIALHEDTDSSTLRLLAAGPYGHIVPYDISFRDDACGAVCPVAVMLHVARTSKAITKASTLKTLRTDSFYRKKLPQTIISLPVSKQGRQAGVILLSSLIATTTDLSANAREVISCLATLSTIITANASFTRRLKSEVDQRTKELQNALQAKTQFLSQCSHELRSPLSAVLGLAAVLEESPGLSDVQREHIGIIRNSSNDLLGLINNILDHSRLENHSVTLERIHFTLRDVVETALDTIGTLAQGKDVEVCLITGVKNDPPGLMGDPFRVKQVLLNLLSNAVKFTSKGHVTVEWSWREGDDGKVHIAIVVKDTGIGIPAHKMHKLFKSFSQVDSSTTRNHGGSGLGLIISKDLAQLLGGDCVATSEYGHGSQFTFTFVADKSAESVRQWDSFKTAKSCFVICPPSPWWDMLDANLNVLNLQPVRFKETIEDCFVENEKGGLNSAISYDFIFLDVQLIDKDMIRRMRGYQPNAMFIFLVRNMDLTTAMRKFDIARESIIARPIKFVALHDTLLKGSSSETRDQSVKKKDDQAKQNKGKRRATAKSYPLRILLVDDNFVNVTVGKRVLGLFGYDDVVTAHDGQQAVEAAEKTRFDLILLDLQMPVMDGFTAQERITASPITGTPCVVALSANVDQATQQRCVEADFFDYLPKPMDLGQLERLLKRASEHRQAT